MSELGIGVDIETIDRFSKKKRPLDDSFLNRIFTEKELDYCFSYKTATPHLAVRYAAKEAVIKSLTAINREKGIYYKNIEVLNQENKSPSATILKEGYSDLQITISLSHSKDTAIAFCIIQMHNSDEKNK